jgi:hypothetical protein
MPSGARALQARLLLFRFGLLELPEFGLVVVGFVGWR